MLTEEQRLQRNEYQRNYKKDDPVFKAKRVEYQTYYRYKDKEKALLKQAKHRAKKNNIPFNIELEDVIIPEYCPILGIKLDKDILEHTPSMDKIDNKRGYVKGNIAIISRRANRLKQDSTLEELEAIVRYMKEHLNV